MANGPRAVGILVIMVTLIAVLAALFPASSPAPAEPVVLSTEVLETLPHDPAAYTQGLLWYAGQLYESTGQYGQSTIRRVDPATGEVLVARDLPPDLFGEGLARIDDRLVQLTWRRGVALVWDREMLSEVARLNYEGEGWGLCFDGRHLVMSDGSSRLTFRDPESFEVVRQIEVLFREGAVSRLNELECAEGWIYANVYTTDRIVQIDPQTGRVHRLIDASGLLEPGELAGADVLNGIAFDEDRQVFYVTGKLWPKMFVVRFVPSEGN